jgi:hypothetical protein
MEQLTLTEYMQPIRKINTTEQLILAYLVKKGSLQLQNGWLQNVFVQQMEDGGMGSFLIFQDASEIGDKRIFGKQVSEFEFVDDDGILVIVSLNMDQYDKLFEVDVWKTDYKPVITFKVPEK